MTSAEQAQLDKFKQAARDLEADENEAHWDERLKQVTAHKPKQDAPK